MLKGVIGMPLFPTGLTEGMPTHSSMDRLPLKLNKELPVLKIKERIKQAVESPSPFYTTLHI